MDDPLANPSAPRFPTWLLTGVLGAIMVALAIWPGAGAALQMDREALAAGQWWRLLTCHVVHWNADHALWDTAVFAVLGALCESRGRGRYALCLVLSGAVISLGVWLLVPSLATYRGASGVDSALFGLLLLAIWRETAPRFGWRLAAIAAVALGFAVKVAWETAAGTTIFVDSAAAGLIPVPLAHALGAAIGVAVGIGNWTAGRSASGGAVDEAPGPGPRVARELNRGSCVSC